MALFARRNALTGVKRAVSAEPLLPFLYNTRTIRTQYTDALSDFENEQESSTRPSDSTFGSQRPSRHNSRRDPPGYRTFRKLDLSKNGNESPANEASGESESQPRRHQRIDHIPFEETAQETDSIRAQLEGSTMTPAERKAFEELLSMPRKTVSKNEKDGGAKTGESLDDIMNKAQAEILAKRRPAPRVPEELQRMIKERRPDEDVDSGAQLALAIQADKEQVNEAFQEAKTDIELWNILHEKVISRVLALNLDAPPPPVVSRRRTKKSKKEEQRADDTSAGEDTAQWGGGITDEMVITRNFERHLLDFHTHCRTVFPSSQLPPSLLPHLKTFGPAVYALGAGTALYNQHMRALYLHDLDLPAIVNTLEDMDKDVFELDHSSLRVLQIILKKSRSARLGLHGPGTAALWNGERFQKARSNAIKWSKTIKERLKELALEEARARQESPVRYLA